MKLQEFLNNNKIINVAELARLMFPGKKAAPQYLSNKLNNISTAPNRAPQQLTKGDIQKAIEVLKGIAEDISKIDT